jgi:thiol-disulfide isomerase/thioredoxin
MSSHYVNFKNTLPPLPENSSMLSRVMTAGSNLSTNSILILLGVIVILGVGIYMYFYHISPSSSKFYPNNEPGNNSPNSNNAELMFFYADWCPHCKTAKPIWNDLKTEYENKTIKGYKIIFTEVDCSEETAEVEKLMNQYNIEGYPTIKLIKDGQIIDYDAKPSKEVLVQFLNTVL